MIQPTQPNPRAEEFRQAGAWEGRTVTSFLREAANQAPDRLALVQGESRLTYRQVWTETLRLAAGLDELGLKEGSVVSYTLPNWAETVLLHHAVTALGLVNNPIVPIYRHSEISFIASQAKPSLIVIPHRFRGFDYLQMLVDLRAEGALPHSTRVAVVRPFAPLPDGFIPFTELFGKPRRGRHGVDRSQPEDITLLLYTSGTTAAAKGVLHPHQTLVYENRSIARWFGLGPQDAIFMASPLTHITGVLYGLQLPAMLRATVVLQDVWEPAAGADLIEQEGCTFSVGSTPFLQGLVDIYERRAMPSRLRVFACGGADVPPALVRRARERLDTVVVRAYGSSEFPTLSSSRADDPIDKAAETDGQLILSAECRVCDDDGREVRQGQVGELAVNGPERFLGYLDPDLNEGAFTSDGSFFTGDLASVDTEGFITIQGRKKDIIIRLGQNISAKEVEDLLFEHPAVAEVAVVAMPDPRLGEKACVYVVTVPGAQFDFAEMTRFLTSRRVARQKFPEHLELVQDSLPKTASGKIQKFRLREDARVKAAGSESATVGGAQPTFPPAQA